MTNIDKSNFLNLNHFGGKIRELRVKRGLLLRQMASFLEADTALMSKIERGERPASREQVLKIAKFLNAETYDLLALWMADKIESTIVQEPEVGYRALKIVKNKINKKKLDP